MDKSNKPSSGPYYAETGYFWTPYVLLYKTPSVAIRDVYTVDDIPVDEPLFKFLRNENGQI